MGSGELSPWSEHTFTAVYTSPRCSWEWAWVVFCPFSYLGTSAQSWATSPQGRATLSTRGHRKGRAWPTQVSDNIAMGLNEIEEFQRSIRNILTEKLIDCKGEIDHFRAEKFNTLYWTKKVKFGSGIPSCRWLNTGEELRKNFIYTYSNSPQLFMFGCHQRLHTRLPKSTVDFILFYS